jgi:hypothetical protein
VSLYQDSRGRTKRTWVDWLVLIAVVGIAVLVILTSFHNTSKLAHVLEMPPGLMASVLEIAYGTFLFLRARQRALNLHTPIFLHVLYYITFGLVTAVNMWGLYIVHHAWGIVIGGAISFLMWGFETTLVWLWTRSREPYKKGFVKRVLDLIRNRIKAMIEAFEEREAQNLAWIKYDAKRSSLKLIKKVRKAENKRKKVIGDEELPEFFEWLKKQGDVEQITLELERTEPKVVDVDADVQTLPARRIGFHAEDERRVQTSVQTSVQSSVQTVQTKKKSDIAYEIAKKMHKQNHEVPSCRQIVKNAAEHNMKISVGTAKAGRDRLIEELNQ